MFDRMGDLPGRWVRIVDETEQLRLEEELTRECGSTKHPLYGVEAQAVAHCGICDDVLYGLPCSGRWAVVHLTWARETDPHHPSCDLFDDWSAVTNELLDRGH
jgi:hypothetical protein